VAAAVVAKTPNHTAGGLLIIIGDGHDHQSGQTEIKSGKGKEKGMGMGMGIITAVVGTLLTGKGNILDGIVVETGKGTESTESTEENRRPG